jgi:hypothetical protein
VDDPIPALDGITQARFPGEIEEMARDYIALVTDTPVAEIEVHRTRLGPPSGVTSPTVGLLLGSEPVTKSQAR